MDLVESPVARPSRRRGAALESAILDAAWDVLVEEGYPGFTFEAVAARAGTSRPVLYRRWSGREELLLAAVRTRWLAEPVPIPDTGTLRGDALAYLRAANAGRLRFAVVATVQLTEYFRETGTSFDDLRAHLGIGDRPSAAQIIVDRAVARGELSDAPRPRRVVSLLFDLVRHELLLTMRPATDEAIREIVDDVWLPLLRAGDSRGRRRQAAASSSRSSSSR